MRGVGTFWRLLAAAVACAFAVAADPGVAGSTRELVQVDVSNAAGVQSETTITSDPSTGRILLAGSNDHRRYQTYAPPPSESASVRQSTPFSTAFYGSVDGGATWRRSYLPLVGGQGASDPVVAIDLTGRQYAGFVRVDENGQGEPRVSSRPNALSPWSAPTVVEQTSGTLFDDDKPAIAVDVSPSSPHANRVYVAWSRISPSGAPIVLAHSDDGGTTWSVPALVSKTRTSFQSYPSIAVARDGSVYVAWWTVGHGVFADVSHDGGDTFGTARSLNALAISGTPTCVPPGVSIPAQPTTCVRPNPIISVDDSTGPLAGRVYVTYNDTAGKHQQQGIFVAALDPALRPLFLRHPVNRPKGSARSDQFWPASAVDPSTGVLWACFYDTRADRRRRLAWYSCTRSRDGGARWAAPLRVASVPSNETQRGADKGGGLNREYGDYEGLAVAGGVAHPIWTDTRRLRTLAEEVYTTTLSERSFRLRSRG